MSRHEMSSRHGCLEIPQALQLKLGSLVVATMLLSLPVSGACPLLTEVLFNNDMLLVRLQKLRCGR